MPKASRDYLSEATELVELLRKVNDNAMADELLAAIESGSTGTEIAMAVRFTTQRFLKDRKLPENIQKHARQLVRTVDALLK